MKNYRNPSFTAKIRTRIRVLWGIFVLMLIYMIIIGELKLGDSRIMTTLSVNVSKFILFGGIGYVIYRIVHNKKLLQYRSLLLEQQKQETDERVQFLYDKTGGIVVDILLVILLFVTCTAAFSNMTAFNISLGILVTTVSLKTGSYIFYNRKY